VFDKILTEIKKAGVTKVTNPSLESPNGGLDEAMIIKRSKPGTTQRSRSRAGEEEPDNGGTGL